MNIGTLTIEMAANIAKLSSDMDLAKRTVGSAMDQIKGAADVAGKALGALGVATTVGGLAAMIESTIEASAELYKLSQRTGATVESLSAMRDVAKLSGTDMTDVATGMQKLSRSMVDSLTGTGRAAQTFRELGVSVTDGNGKLKTADQMMIDVAKSLQGFERGAGTTAAMLNIFGKAGANLAPMLTELAEKGELNTKVTAEQAKQAEEFMQAQIKLRIAVQDVVRSIAMDVLPVLQKLPGLFKIAMEAAAAYVAIFIGLPFVMAKSLAAFNLFAVAVYEGETLMTMTTATMNVTLLTLGPTFEALTVKFGIFRTAVMTAFGVIAAAFLGWQIGAWLRENFVEAQLAGIAFVKAMLDGWENVKYGAQVAWAAIAAAWDTTISGMGGVLSGFLDKIAGGLSALGLSDASAKVLQWASNVNTATASTSTFASRMAVLNAEHEKAKKGIESITDDMADEAIAAFAAADAHEKRKKALNVSVGKDDNGNAKKLMDAQVKEQELAIAAEMKLLDSREKSIEFYHGLEFMTLRDAETKKQELLMESRDKVKADYDKEIDAIKGFIATGKALQASGDTAISKKGAGMVIDGVKALQEATAKQAAAVVAANAAVGESQQKLLGVQVLFNNATAERARQAGIADQSAQFQIDMMGKSTLQVQLATNARRIQLDLEERIYQLQKKDPKADTSSAVAQAAIETAQTNARITETYEKQRDAIFGASEALRKYQEDATNIGANVEGAMTRAFKGMEDALVQFVTTGKLNFKSLAQSIIADMVRIQIQQSVTGPLSVAIKGLFTGGGTAATAETAIAGFAGGGRPPVGVPSMVGERGPELFVPDSAGTIVPNGAGTTNHFSTSIHIDSRTDSAEVYSTVGRALQENNQRFAEQLRQQGAIA